MIIVLISSKNQIINTKSYFKSISHLGKSTIVICFYNHLVQDVNFHLKPKSNFLIPISKFNSLQKYIYFFLKSIKLIFFQNNTVIIGDTMSRYKHYVLFLLKPKKIVVVDDGIKSVYSLSENLNFCMPKTLFKKVSFVFTNYDLKFSNLKYYYNKLSVKKRNNIKKDEVWFIGQPLLEDNRIKKNELIDKYNIILNRFKTKKIVYFMHPREKISYKFFKTKFLRESKGRFEDFFEKCNHYPESIVTFYSSSIDYCIRSSESEINFFYVKIDVDERVKAIYSYLSKIGVKELS